MGHSPQTRYPTAGNGETHRKTGQIKTKKSDRRSWPTYVVYQRGKEKFLFQVSFLVKEQISWVQWLMLVIPALWEAKEGGSRGQEFQTSLANTVKPRLY